jgi:thioredoxin-dependent peroxiredoxin
LEKHKIIPIGISPDRPETLKKFDEKYSLKFTLLSDPDKSVADAYGAFGKKIMYGKEVSGIIRSVVMIDEKGVVLGASYKITPEDTVPLALKMMAG